MMPTEEQTYRAGIVASLERIESKIDVVDEKQTYTNGKVRKIIIALVLMGGIIIGQGTTNYKDVAQFFIGIAS